MAKSNGELLFDILNGGIWQLQAPSDKEPYFQAAKKLKDRIIKEKGKNK